jgi:hypothetical protein
MTKKPHKETASEASDRKAEDEQLDEALDESFPASDPPASTAPGHRFTGHEDGKSKKEKK